MPRDYKHKTSRKTTRHQPKKKGNTPGWVWMIAGLAIGLFIAFAMNLTGSLQLRPMFTANTDQTPKQTSNTRDLKKKTRRSIPPPKRYDFYTMLPEMEVVVPEVEHSSPTASLPPVTHPGVYVLQVGSFRRFAEADRLKAELALTGIQAHIQRVTINNDATWHRVRIGPFKKLAKLNKIRNKLKAQGKKSILLKLKS